MVETVTTQAAARREPLARLGIALLVVSLVASLAAPVLFALAPPLADALDDAGSTAVLASVVVSVALLAGVLYAATPGARAQRILFAAGAWSAVAVLVLFPLQMSVFALAWPPPSGAAEHFELLTTDRLVGLLSLDVLMMLDWVVLLVLWGALFVALRPTAPRTMTVAIALVLASTIAYFLSNTAFDMLALSQQHASATDAGAREALLASGERALATFEGPWFTASYLLSGAAAVLASVAMWRAPGFGRLVGGVGIAYGALQLVPPNVGTVGMVVSLASLLPMLVWLVLLARRLRALSKSSEAAA